MKRLSNLYPVVCDTETIRMAIRKASLGKRKHKYVRNIVEHEDFYIEKIQKMLLNKSYVPSEFTPGIIYDGMRRKRREIAKPKFYPDQIVHWCIYLAIKQKFFKSFYEYSCGSIEGRGVHKGKKYINRMLYGDRRNTKYYLKLDVHHFYQSIQVSILMDKLKRRIKDDDFLQLVQTALSQSDTLLIGMLLSQIFANFFLNDFDHWLKQDKKVKHYVRYMDDMVIFGSNKRALHKLRKEIQEELQKIGLELKPNWQVYRLDKEPLDFMGFRFYRNRTVLRKSIMLRISRRVSRAAKRKQPTRTDAFAIVSYMGWIKCTDTNGFYEKWIKPKVDFNQLKNMIRSYSKNENVQKRKRQQAISVGQDILGACGIPQL